MQICVNGNTVSIKTIVRTKDDGLHKTDYC